MRLWLLALGEQRLLVAGELAQTRVHLAQLGARLGAGLLVGGERGLDAGEQREQRLGARMHCADRRHQLVVVGGGRAR